jgi:hypothetical protein
MIHMLVATLFLSEILANEPGSTVSLEWIELAATSATLTSESFLVVNTDTVVLPALAIDSGKFLVICRDSVRFEQHYGDSSGAWGDGAGERYALVEAAFALANASGHVELFTPSGRDAFSYTQASPDGVSNERIGDTAWQLTNASVGCTPGARNHGVPWPYDWAVAGVSYTPARPKQGDVVRIQSVVHNCGTNESTAFLRLLNTDSIEIAAAELAGGPGTVDTTWFDCVAEDGYNSILVLLADDDRLDNNAMHVAFYASASPLLITEIYAVPAMGEPEWLELYVAADTAIACEMLLADQNDTVPFGDLLPEWPAGSYTVVTADITAFLTYYSEFDGVVVQPPEWPTLNNDGDTLSVLYFGATVERVGYPSFGARRGVSYERVGASGVWAFSVSNSGSTPGIRNSIDVAYSSDIGITVAPNPFAPGQGEQALISFVTPFAATGELKLYSGDGRYLRTLLPQAPMVSGEVYWDGRGGNGKLLPIGMYLLQLKVTNPAELSRLAVIVIAR